MMQYYKFINRGAVYRPLPTPGGYKGDSTNKSKNAFAGRNLHLCFLNYF